MRTYVAIAGFAILSASCWGQSPIKIGLLVTNDGGHFAYTIDYPELASKVWIEVLDGPTVLDRTPIPVKASGELDWAWKGAPAGEDEDDQLKLSIWDPNGISGVDTGLTTYAEPGGTVSAVTVGARKGEIRPDATLDGSLIRVQQGSASLTFVATGRDLHRTTMFHVLAEEGARCRDSDLPSEVLNMGHARITLDSQCFRDAGAITILPANDYRGADDAFLNGTGAVWVRVASRKSPVLRSVSPSTLPADTPEDDVELTLHGSGFSENSEIYAGYLPNAAFAPRELLLDTEYVSPTELRARGPNENESVGRALWPHDRLRIWVEGDQDKSEISEPRDIEIRGSTGEKRLRQTALITSVSPFPIHLMTGYSPEELMITIRGENFIRENRVQAGNTHDISDNTVLRTEYVSSSELRAWIPRQYWRKHKIAYRLVVETTSGLRYTRQIQRDD